jgi:pimeloyl-ACP methyl ester carboxylesterase
VRLTARPAGLLLVLSLAAACSGGSSHPAAQPTPTVSPTPASTPTKGHPSPAGHTAVSPHMGVLSTWKACDNGFQCATLTVPLDEKKPSLGTVALALTRHRATGSHRIGSLITNPGGPGASAVDWLQGSYGEFPSAIRKRFDLVTFDPRGVGHTSPVHCLTTSGLDAYFHLDPAPDSAKERAALLQGDRTLAAGCLRRSARILPYVTTKIVAQDLDRVRQAVGDAKLTYLGYSYGTAVGASYLDQFPTRVRAMVLDGALDPAMTWDQFVAGQSMGFDVALKAFLADCQRNRCAFRDAVQGDLGAAFDALAHKVEASPLPGDGTRTVGPDEFTLGVGAGLYSRRNGWPAIADALAAAERGDGAGLLSLNDLYLERGPDGYSTLSEANYAVNCIDRPWPRSEAPYYALAAKVAKSYPRFGPAITLSGLGCAVWPVPATGRPHAVHAPGSPAVLVVGQTRDPATPYVWAQALARELSHGVLLTHDGDGHTVYRVGAPACLLQPINDYLLSLRVPGATRC